MHDRIEKGLKLLSAALGALLLAHFAIAALRPNPLRDIKIPEPPTLPEAVTNVPGQSATNAIPSAKRTNAIGTNAVGTNVIGKSNQPSARVTNSPAVRTVVSSSLSSSSRPGKPSAQRELPPQVKARIDKIIDTELLGPVPRPVPMALLGIAGNSAMLRSTNGQQGLIKIGEEIGGLKLVKIGVNRVLVEQNGQQSELMIFSGFGGESLLSKEQNSK
jgi:hypothetical protein